MVLLIDNYDSFSYNLFQLVGELTNGEIKVVRNDAITIDEIKGLDPEAIILSPGPGRPENSGICPEVVDKLKGLYPILGVCLGHQVICQSFGAEVSYAKRLMHGKQSDVMIEKNDTIFDGLRDTFKGGRYHSLSAVEDSMPDELMVIAKSMDDGEVMAVKHENYYIYGLQFHPESVLTKDGRLIVYNFLKNAKMDLIDD